MFEGMNLGDMGKMFEQVQQKANEMQEQSKHIQFSVQAGGGMVEILANGLGEVNDVRIDDSLLEDKSSLQILLISAMNDLAHRVEEHKKSQATGLMGGMNPFAK
jgi:nucleoid-associated protein EbfC